MTKEFKKGKYLLTHNRFINYMGLEVDNFDIFDTEERIHYPVTGFIKVHDKSKDFPINRIPYDFDDKDYEEMIDQHTK